MAGCACGTVRGGMDTAPSIRSLVPTVYLPTFLFAVGQGAVLPVVALTARQLGASVALAGFAVALQGIGRMLFNIPAGRLIDRIGERPAMSVGTAILLASLVAAVVSPGAWWFAGSMFLMGCGWSVWLLARLTYVSEVMPFHLRGRALSTLGGVHRIGSFAGPFLGAAVLSFSGIDGAYYVHIVLAVAGLLTLLLIPDPYDPDAPPPAVPGSTRIVELARRHSRVFLTAGFGATALSLLRASRHAVVPLWGAHIGLDAAQVSLVFGISGALDMTLFYPAGSISDRWGRKAVAVPCLTLLSASFAALPLTDSFLQVVAVGLVMGLGNGLGSGIVMTLGADFAPATARAAFLGLWRMVSDVGAATGPLLFGAIAGAATLAVGSGVVALIGFAGAGVIAVALPRPADAGGGPVASQPAEGGADVASPTRDPRRF